MFNCFHFSSNLLHLINKVKRKIIIIIVEYKEIGNVLEADKVSLFVGNGLEKFN